MKIKSLIFCFLLTSVLTANSQSAFKVVVSGKGQPILLFPGFGCTGEVWNDAVAELSKHISATFLRLQDLAMCHLLKDSG